MTLTIEEIYNLAVYAGLVIDEKHSILKEDRESEIMIKENTKIKMDDGTFWKGRGACFADYPDDRWVIIKEYEC